MIPLVLASQSVYKRSLFSRLGLEFNAIEPLTEEVFQDGLTPLEQAENLSLQKAQSLMGSYPNSVIIGADQVLAFDNRLLQKPNTVENAVNQLKMMRGKEHQLYTAVSVLHKTKQFQYTGTVISRIKFYKELSDAFLRKVVLADKTWDCVGGYKIESMGISLMESCQTEDFTAIIGLPLMVITRVLRKLGYYSDS